MEPASPNGGTPKINLPFSSRCSMTYSTLHHNEQGLIIISEHHPDNVTTNKKVAIKPSELSQCTYVRSMGIRRLSRNKGKCRLPAAGSRME